MAGFEDKLQAILGDQEAMGQIMALARSLSGDEGEPPKDQGRPSVLPEPQEGPDLAALLGQVDPAWIQAGLDVVRQLQQGEDRSAALLDALRPFLRPERQAKLDRAVQIARMSRAVKILLKSFQEGEERGSV